MHNYAETCQSICGYNLVYNIFVYLLPLKSSVFVVYFSNAILAWEGGISKTWFLDLNSSSACYLSFDI